MAKDREDEQRIAEWAAAPKTEISDPVTAPQAIGAEPARFEDTGRHRLTPAQFATGVELAERDGYVRGFQHGHAAGVLEGRADVRAQDLDDGVELVMEAIRATLFAAGETAASAEEISETIKRRIRRR